ncbi:heavy-metal-associated domain-containing protein [Lentibacillus saliphilus]|uniref:heavy-metal-associated domain-containing protein n=1 Tax=Lentibacillus saliphilus TaxID=2737028 RepID=UPI001C2FE196|nr:heavy-metal-associated domain-containing protein [Lentibacillus saliphilus]
MKTIKLQLEPLTCPSCIKKIEHALGKITGVDHVGVLFNSSKVKVTIDEQKVSDDEIRQTIEKLGFQVI